MDYDKCFFRNLLKNNSVFWSKLTITKKITFTVIFFAVIVAFAMAIYSFTINIMTPVLSPVFSRPITDEVLLDRIVARIEQEGVIVTVTPDNIVRVQDEETASRMRIILISDNLLPTRIEPWEIFDRERWTITDMERNVNFQRRQEKMIAEHIKAIEGIDNIRLYIVWPVKELFAPEQNPVSVSLIIIPTLGSDITTNRKKIEGIQKTLKSVIEGLKDENIAIIDQNGFILNNFE
jgi:flagellar M-ring protein FliF